MKDVPMRAIETTLTSKGQVTIPAQIRSQLGLRPRDKVRFEVDGDAVRIRPVPSKVLRWYGSVTPKTKLEDFREGRREFEEGVASDVVAEG